MAGTAPLFVIEGLHVAVDGTGEIQTSKEAAPFPDGDDYVIPNVMLFRVNRPLSGPDRSSLPSDLVPLSILDPGSAVRVRQLTLTETDRESDGFPVIALLDQKRWHDPVTEADKALEEFRRTHPEYRIADAMWERVKPR